MKILNKYSFSIPSNLTAEQTSLSEKALNEFYERFIDTIKIFNKKHNYKFKKEGLSYEISFTINSKAMPFEPSDFITTMLLFLEDVNAKDAALPIAESVKGKQLVRDVWRGLKMPKKEEIMIYMESRFDVA